MLLFTANDYNIWYSLASFTWAASRTAHASQVRHLPTLFTPTYLSYRETCAAREHLSNWGSKICYGSPAKATIPYFCIVSRCTSRDCVLPYLYKLVHYLFYLLHI